MKRIFKLLLVILVLGLCYIGYVVYDGFHGGASRINVRHEVLSSTKIPNSLDNVQILIISDVHYNNFMDKDRFQVVVDKVNKLHPDVIIFLGDMFDDTANNMPSTETIEQITAQFKQLQAPLGMFAILGEEDLRSPEIKGVVTTILNESDFEILENNNIKIYNGQKEYIQLVGVENSINSVPNLEQAFLGIDYNRLTITLCHTPDTVSRLPGESELILTGHSHGGQIYIPFIGPLEDIEYAVDYNHGRYSLDNDSTILDVVNGVGNRKTDVRIFADAEIVIYQLLSLK